MNDAFALDANSDDSVELRMPRLFALRRCNTGWVDPVYLERDGDRAVNIGGSAPTAGGQ